MRNIQPWCISRQLWWGHQIPAWYGPDGTVFVEETEEAALSAARERFGHDVELSRDEDVLDTWFSSALWPFRSEEHTSELQSLMRISYAVFCLKKKNHVIKNNKTEQEI